MDKLIHFKDNYFNIRHIIRIDVQEKYILIKTTDGIYRFEHTEYRINPMSYGYYDEAEKKQFLEDIESMM